MTYDIIQAACADELTVKVRARLAEGWTPQGGVAVTTATYESSIIGRTAVTQAFYQAVTRVEHPADADDDLQDRISAEVGRRVQEYRKYWNPESGKFEIDKGDPQREWICTEDELYDDIRRSVEDELS